MRGSMSEARRSAIWWVLPVVAVRSRDAVEIEVRPVSDQPRRTMSRAARRPFRIAATSETAASASSLTTTASNRSASASSASAWAIRRASCSGSSVPRADEALPLHLPGRRPQEHEQRVGDLLPDRHGALDVDLHEHVLTGREARARPARGACPSAGRRPRTTRGSRRRPASRSNSSRLRKR